MEEAKYDLEIELWLNKFQARSYQKPLMDAILNNKYKRVLGIMPRRCLAGDTQILVPGGNVRLLKDLRKGDRILAFDGTKIVEDEVVDQWKTNTRSTSSVQGQNQLKITCTPDHKFASQAINSTTFTPAQNLEDIPVLTYIGYEVEGIDDPLLGEFLGYMFFGGATNEGLLTVVERLMKLLFQGPETLTVTRDYIHTYLIGLTTLDDDDVREAYIQSKKEGLLKRLWELSNSSLEAFFCAAIHAQHDTIKSQDKVSCVAFDIYGDKEFTWSIYWLLRRIGILADSPNFDGNTYQLAITDLYSLRKLKVLSDCCIPIIETLEVEDRPNFWNGLRETTTQYTKAKRIYTYDIETKEYHNFFANGYLVHNSGKDLTAWNIAIRQCIRRPCTVYYCLPKFNQARRVIWDALDSNGRRFL